VHNISTRPELGHYSSVSEAPVWQRVCLKLVILTTDCLDRRKTDSVFHKGQNIVIPRVVTSELEQCSVVFAGENYPTSFLIVLTKAVQ